MVWREHTFLLSDVQGSTRLWDRSPGAMAVALARHDELVAELVARHDGRHVKARGEGDSTFNVFPDPVDAVRAAIAIQQALADERWPASVAIVARMSLHIGMAQERADDFYGPTVNRCARIRSAAHGGQVVVSGAVAAALPADIMLIDHGQHRLPDLTEPEHLHEVVVEGTPGDHPPLRTLDAAHHNLPRQRTTLVGRDAELREIATGLTGPRLITLTGPGGSGKTRLALQVAAELVPTNPAGTWFVPLAPARTHEAVVSAVISATGIGVDDADPVAGLAAGIGSDRALLVLDNCEHVIDDAAGVVDTLLDACPNLRVLATSQVRLHLPGERVQPVAPLALPDVADDVAAVGASHAVQLFLARAELAGAEVTLDERTAPAVASICHRLDGIPLAIELAAARLRVLSVTQLDQQLDDRFRVLTGGPRSAPDRHRTMRNAVAWSHDLLDEPHQHLLHALSVLRGPWTLDAVQVLVDRLGLEVDAIDGLTELVDRSLVTAEPGTDGTSMRHTLLESIRQFAREQLEARGALEATRDAHLDWILTVYHADPPSIPEHRWDELDDARAALEHGLAGRAVDVAPLVPRVESHLFHRGGVAEARTLVERTLAAGDDLDAAVRLELHVVQMDNCSILGDRDASRRHAALALALIDDVDDARVLSRAGVMLGKHHYRGGDAAAGIRWMRRGLDAARRLGAGPVTLNALSGLGQFLRWSGHDDEGDALLDEAVELAARLASPRQASALIPRATSLLPADPTRATVLLRQVIATGDVRGREHRLALATLALVLHAVADDDARPTARRALDLALEEDDPFGRLYAAAAFLAVRSDPHDPTVIADRLRWLDRSALGLEGPASPLLLLADLTAQRAPGLAARLLHAAVATASPPLPTAWTERVGAAVPTSDRLPPTTPTEPLAELSAAVLTWVAATDDRPV
jgi:predicted ATPase/class 3 adenylate cyclase